jgi:hypothetical protein
MIFTPQWVREQLFSDGKSAIKAAVPYMPADPVVYESGFIKLSISDTELTLSLLDVDRSRIKLIEDKAVDVLKILNNTPISSIEVNIEYDGINIPNNINDMFSGKYSKDFNDLGWSTIGNRMSRLISKPGRFLSVDFSLDSNREPKLLFCFFFITDRPEEAVKAIKGQTSSFLNEIQVILQKVYQVDARG